MLTEKEIEAYAKNFYKYDSSHEETAFITGAIWATGKAVTEIAEMLEVVKSLKAGYEDLIRAVKMDNNHFDIVPTEKAALSRADELIKKHSNQ